MINFKKTVFYCTWDSIIWLCVSGDQLWDNYFLLYLRQYYLTPCIRWSTLRKLFSIVYETVLFDSVYQVINFEKTVFLLYLRQYYLTLCIRWSTLRKLFSIVYETVLFDSVYQVINFEKTVFILYLRQYYLTLCIRWSTLRKLFSIVYETVLFDSVYQVINFEKTVFLLYLRQYYLTLCIRWSTLRKLFFYCTWDSIIWLCVSGNQLWENCFSIVPETVLFDSVYQVINFEKTVFLLYLRQYYLTLCIRWSTLRQLFSIVPETVLFDSVYQVINFETIIFYCTWDSIIWLCVSGDQLWDNYFLLYLRQYYLTLCIRWSTLRQLFSIVPETVLFDSVYQVINFETIIFYCTWDSIIWLCVSGDQLWENCFLLYLRQYYLTLCIRWSTLRKLFSIVPETVIFDSVYQVINFEKTVFYCTWDSLFDSVYQVINFEKTVFYCTWDSLFDSVYQVINFEKTVFYCTWDSLFDSVYQVINFQKTVFSCTWDSYIWLCVSGDQLWENYFLLYLRQYYLTLCIRWSTLRKLFSIVPETVLFDSVYQVINFEKTVFYCTWDSIIWLCVSGNQL